MALQNKINQFFGVAGLLAIPCLFNTNLCETLNSAVFHVAPKTIRYSTNFNALCHSATHSWTVGAGLSTVELARAAGITVNTNSTLYLALKRKDKKKTLS